MRHAGRLLLLTALLALVGPPGPVAAEDEPAGEPAWAACERAVTWFHAARVPAAEAEMKALVAEGRMAAWSRDWIAAALEAAPSLADCLAEAARRKTLLFWYVPAVEGQHIILPHLLDRYVMTGPLSDPDVTTLLNRRFVCLKLPAGGALAEKYGLTAPGFVQPGVLVLKPDGTVVHRMDRISTFQPAWWDALLRDLATRFAAGIDPELAAARRAVRPQADDTSRLRLAHELAAHGLLAEAGAWLKPIRFGEHAAAAHFLRARLALRRRDVDEALRHAGWVLDRAKTPADGWPARIVMAQAYLGTDLPRQARTALRMVGPEGTPLPLPAEAGFLAGVAAWALKDTEAAIATWREVVSAYPGSIWAAKAAACCETGSDGRLGEAALVRGMDTTRFSGATAYPRGEDQPAHPAPQDSGWRRTPGDVGDITKRALRFLLRQQREDGSWPGFRWGGDAARPAGETPRRQGETVDIAIAAACCAALHRHLAVAPEAIQAALERGERFILDESRIRRGEDDTAWIYADAYKLRYLAMSAFGPGKDHAAGIKHMEDLVKHLRKHQVAGGGAFRHYVYKSTFATAAVLACLHEARRVGARVPRAMFTDGCRVLAATQDPKTLLYGYLIDKPAATRTRLGAANRQPLCDWPRVRDGGLDFAVLPAALDTFLEAYEDSAALARKTNFHVPALDQTAGYYFFHNFHAACIAARDAGPKANEYMQKLLALLCALPESDGTFLDSGFSYGKCYATAMALQSIHLLTTPLPPR